LLGKTNHNPNEQPLKKLKALYKFLEQLYVGSSYCVMAVKNTKAPPRHIMEMLKELSTVSEWIKELTKSACRQGADYLVTCKGIFPRAGAGSNCGWLSGIQHGRDDL
jgi:hypothetical protein